MMRLGLFRAIPGRHIVAISLTTSRGALAIRAAAMGWAQTSYIMADVILVLTTGQFTRA
jgi:hypothetical protein